MRSPIRAWTGLLFACALLAARPAPAQFPMPSITPPAPAEVDTSDPYGRETPRGCLFGFFRAAQHGSLETSAAYLQIPPSLEGSRLAIAHQLQVVFDRRFVTVNMDRLSRSARGSLDDGLAPELEKVGEVRGGDGFIDVVLVRREPPGGGGPIWLISWDTIRQCRQIYDRLKLRDIDSMLPPVLVNTRLGAMELWQIVAFLLLLVVLFAVSWLLVAVVVGLLHLVRRKRSRGGAVMTWAGSARSPATLILTLLLHRACVNFLGVPVLYRLYYDRVILVLLFGGMFWLLSRLIDAVNRLFDANPRAFMLDGLDYRDVHVGSKARKVLEDRSGGAADLRIWTLPRFSGGCTQAECFFSCRTVPVHAITNRGSAIAAAAQ